jgi:hypothetical protein
MRRLIQSACFSGSELQLHTIYDDRSCHCSYLVAVGAVAGVAKEWGAQQAIADGAAKATASARWEGTSWGSHVYSCFWSLGMALLYLWRVVDMV